MKRKNKIVCFIFKLCVLVPFCAFLLSLQLEAAIIIELPEITVAANSAKQTFDVYLQNTGDPLTVTGIGFNIQVADGGVNGTTNAPAITDVDIFKGTIFELNNNGESGSGSIVAQVYEQGTITASGLVSLPSGISKIATVTLNTVGLKEGTYPLTLNTLNGATKYTTTSGEFFPTLIDGSVTIAPVEARAWTNVPCFIQYDRQVREIRIYWQSIPEVSYVVYAAEKISGPWLKVSETVATTNKAQFLDQPNLKSRFYRIEGLSGATITGMAWIPLGTFLMGSAPTENIQDKDEDPQTEVTISKGF